MKALTRDAVKQLWSEGDSTDGYALNGHNRGIEVVADPTCWSVLPGARTSTSAPQLRSLDLSFNRISAIGPLVLAPLVELRDFKGYSNKITNEGIESCGLERLVRLECLELHDNALTQPPATLASSPSSGGGGGGGGGPSKLRVLRLERNRLVTLRHLSRCASLTHLSVDGNRLRGLTEDDSEVSSSNPHAAASGGGFRGGGGGSAAATATAATMTAGAAWLSACSSLEFLSCADNEIERLPSRALQGPRSTLKELVLSRNALGDGALRGLAPLGGCLERLHLEGNHLGSLDHLPPLRALLELFVQGNRLVLSAAAAAATATANPAAPAAASTSRATAGLTAKTPAHSTEEGPCASWLKALPGKCPNLEILDLSQNRISLATSGEGGGAVCAVFAGALRPLGSLNELSVGGNPCTPTDSDQQQQQQGGKPDRHGGGGGRGGEVEWWAALAKALPQLHYLDDKRTGKAGDFSVGLVGEFNDDPLGLRELGLLPLEGDVASGGGGEEKGEDKSEGAEGVTSGAGGGEVVPRLQIPVPPLPATATAASGRSNRRPLSARSSGIGNLSARAAAGPLSARGRRPGLASTPRGAVGEKGVEVIFGAGADNGAGSVRPVMHPPSARTGYGTDFKFEQDPLQELASQAEAFRSQIQSVRGKIRSPVKPLRAPNNNEKNGTVAQSSASSSIQNREAQSSSSSTAVMAQQPTLGPRSFTGGAKGATGGDSDSSDDDDEGRGGGGREIGDGWAARSNGGSGSKKEGVLTAAGAAAGAASTARGADDVHDDGALGLSNEGGYDGLASAELQEQESMLDRVAAKRADAKIDDRGVAGKGGSSNGGHRGGGAEKEEVTYKQQQRLLDSGVTSAAVASTNNNSSAFSSASSASSLASLSSLALAAAQPKKRGPRQLHQALGFASRADAGKKDNGGASSSSSGFLAVAPSPSLPGSGVKSVLADRNPPPPGPTIVKPWLLAGNKSAGPQPQTSPSSSSPPISGVEASPKAFSSQLASSPPASSGQPSPGNRKTTKANSRTTAPTSSIDRRFGSSKDSAATAETSGQHGGHNSLFGPLDLSVLQLGGAGSINLSGGGGGESSSFDAVTMPQPSPRFQTVTTVAERAVAPTPKDRQGIGFKGFKIPAKARQQLSASGRTEGSSGCCGGGAGGDGSEAKSSCSSLKRPAPRNVALGDRTNSPPEAKE